MSTPRPDSSPKTETLQFRVNRDEAPGTAHLETVDTGSVLGAGAWTASRDTTKGIASFSVTEQASGNRAFFGPAPGQIADLRLVSPPIQVGTNAFSVSFRHMYDFERSDGENWDGAIVELSTDDGATWTQVPQSAFASPGGYNGTISNEAENPLGTLQGFSGRSTGWPTTFKTDTMSFGTTYQGQIVRLRFRIGTDQAAGAAVVG